MERSKTSEDFSLVQVAEGIHVWLAPNGSWGMSNAGLILDGRESMIVDTMFDLHLTRSMLDAMATVEPQLQHHVDVLINTHANGDHCHGNELVPTGRIIASEETSAEMDELPPSVLSAMVERFKEDPSSLGRYIQHAFGGFDFSNITMRLPTETFTNEMLLTVGDIEIRLYEVGPAHTRGDVIAYIPSRNVVFTGDILFNLETPIMWSGPVGNWIDACDRIASFDAITVPGHGPVTDRAGALEMRNFWVLLRDQTKERFDAGMGVLDAARDIDLGPYSGWGGTERVFLNVNSLYREFGSEQVVQDVMGLFAEMGAIWTLENDLPAN
ncbi:MAG: MBL fold metallo-hydrolase [Acidimicrobiaceae bacterium]|nr:MBL fold metallo-hydrolase [Acidimicrobiaceae bacterium]